MRAGAVELVVNAGIATLMLDNPVRRNAMSTAMWQQLGECAGRLAHSDGMRCVVVRGAGKEAFCAGADIADFDAARTGPANARAYDDMVEAACVALEAIGCPTIALIHGACMGAGVSIAASCDLRAVSDQARFAVPAARLGLGYDPRGVARFSRVYGAAATHLLLLSGQPLDAERAFQLGAAHWLVPTDELDEAVARVADSIVAGAPLTIAAAKAAIRADALGGNALMGEAMRLYAAADASEDYQEGRRAFAEKRKPRFEGT